MTRAGAGDIEVIEVDPGGGPVEITYLSPDPLADVEVVSISDGPAGASQYLGDLADVDVAAATAGQALRLDPDHVWRGRHDGYTHEQLAPAPEWVIDHDLGYAPGGVRLLDHLGDTVEADVVYPEGDLRRTRVVVTFPFGVSIAGTAFLS